MVIRQKDRPTCTNCNTYPAKKNGKSKLGFQLYKKYCSNCEDTLYKNGRKAYLPHKQDKCERCGFVPEDMCQLDVDHIDGNHSNNDPSNLQTLCANCHRLKTKQNIDGTYAWRLALREGF